MWYWGIKDEFVREVKGSLNDCCFWNLVNFYFVMIFEVFVYNVFYFGMFWIFVYFLKVLKFRVCFYSWGYWLLNWDSDSSWKFCFVWGSLFKIFVLLIDILLMNVNEIDCFLVFM